MWRLLASSELVSNDLEANLTHLLQSTVRKIVISSAILYLLAQLALSATWPLFFAWRNLPVALIVIVTAILAYALIPRQFLLSQIIWCVGIGAAVALAALTYQSPYVLLLLAVLPLAVIVTLGWQAGAVAWGLTVLTPLFLGRQGYISGVTWPLLIGLGLAGALIALLGWATTSSLMTVLIWFLQAEEKSRRNLKDVREHRAQLVATIKQTDQLNYQLARANTALAAAWRTADEALNFKAEFVTNVSHELRTPLNLIIGFSEVIILSPESYGGQKLPGPYRADINAIYNSAKHLMALVDDVLDLGRIDANQFVFARDQVEVESLLQEVQTILRDQIEGKGLEYRQCIEPNLPTLQIDRLRIRQVLLNLLVNALRFTERGSITVEVTQRQDYVQFSVSDTGLGIPEDDLPYIFEPFHSVESQADDAWPEGKGLGLPISKKYVELHGGAMGAESDYGQGATIWFTLPCVSRSLMMNNGASNRDPGRLQGYREPLEPLLILAFNDPATQLLLERRLDDFRLLATENIQEAAALVGDLHPAAVIVDKHDKDEYGSNVELENVPVIPLPWLTSRQIALRLGVADFLIKPVSGEQLLASLDRLPQDIKRVLIADEDPGMVRLHRRMLSARVPGDGFLDAYNSAEVIQRALDERPDLIILAAEMKDERGEPAFHRLATSGFLDDRPHIIVTAEQHWVETGLDWPRTFQVYCENGFSLFRLIDLMNAVLSSLSST
jgi:signal transduction histidine kinase/DNA-binding response OmpR family regulator